MKNRVLITGGLGYIGGRVAKFLAEREDLFLVLGTRQKETARPGWLKNGNVVQLDLMSEESLDLACKEVKCIIHLAALNEIDSAKNSEQALLVNGYGTLKTLRAAERAGVERFIYFSTAHIYGAPLQGNITEKSLPRPVHPYAISHKVAEDFVLAAHDCKSILGIVLRLSNGFGAPINPNVNRWSLLVNDLCRQIATTGKIILKTSGIQKRDFITLTDVCRAVSHCLTLPADECLDGLFNLGGECSLSISEMASCIADRCSHVLGFVPEINAPIMQSDDVSMPFNYSIDKIKSTGFELSSNVTEEIDSELKFCKNEFSINNRI